ncbi:hypothetical protein [Butyrivibrio sp. WCD2001]|uniref:hypothetical protein n=1 Tax=Butyrivibrio sp. WCD2001 TaxID=1280681 RepID=UPI000416D76B|nr:hypothetical protein [Butyrivibrio sp. WCD2001]
MTYEKDAYYMTITSACSKDVEDILEANDIPYEWELELSDMPREVPNYVWHRGEMDINHFVMYKSKTNFIPLIEEFMKEKYCAFRCGYCYPGFEYKKAISAKKVGEEL